MTTSALTLRVDAADRVDRIAKALYGTERGGTVEALLDANPGLAAHLVDSAAIVPEGELLTVPAVEARPADRIVRPWE